MKMISSVCALVCVVLAIVTCTLSSKGPDAIRGEIKTMTLAAGKIDQTYTIDLTSLQFLNNKEARVQIISQPSYQEARVEATYSEDLDNYGFSIQIVEDTISIEMETDFSHPIKKFDISIFANFNHINVGGSGYKLSVDALLIDYISMYVTGDLDIDIEMPDSSEFVLATAGSSNFDLSGNVKNTTIALAGSSVIEATDLLCEKADISISGTGKTAISVSNVLSAVLKGNSLLEYLGNPEITEQVVEYGSVLAQL